MADAEIELMPHEIAGHPAVRATAKRRGKRPNQLLLDASLHHTAMRGLPGAERRGRPDIAHFCLLLALDSIPCRRGQLRTYVHTRNNIVIEFSPETRLPKNYNRFTGLMEEVLLKGKVEADGKVLISTREMMLKDLLLGREGPVYLLDETGRRVKSLRRNSGQAVFVVGGFPHGSFISDLSDVKMQRISLSEERLMAWSVVSLILSSLISQ
ncbi:MAG: 16S rRNA methyltransferase [Methanomassiliicoccales archaeon]